MSPNQDSQPRQLRERVDVRIAEVPVVVEEFEEFQLLATAQAREIDIRSFVYVDKPELAKREHAEIDASFDPRVLVAAPQDQTAQRPGGAAATSEARCPARRRHVSGMNGKYGSTLDGRGAI